jgi:Transposase, Mutator family
MDVMPTSASSTCCATASATPPAATGPPSPRTSPDLHRPTEAAALEALASFAAAWEARYPAIVRLWEHAWAEFVPFLAFDREIRTVIATTNAIESLNARFRRSVKARGHFPNEQAALKHLSLTVVSLDPPAVDAGAGPTAGRPPSTPSTSPSTGASAPAGDSPIHTSCTVHFTDPPPCDFRARMSVMLCVRGR